MWYGCGCGHVVKPSFLTKLELTKLLQLPESMITRAPPIVDDEESLEQIVALLLLSLLHLGAKDMLHNNGLVCHHVLGTEGGVLNIILLTMHLGVVDLVLNIEVLM
jgi:hypothetical protein